MDAWGLEAWLDSLTRVAASTRAVYRRDMAAAAAWLGDRGREGPASVTRRDLRAYLAELDRAGPHETFDDDGFDQTLSSVPPSLVSLPADETLEDAPAEALFSVPSMLPVVYDGPPSGEATAEGEPSLDDQAALDPVDFETAQRLLEGVHDRDEIARVVLRLRPVDRFIFTLQTFPRLSMKYSQPS